MRTMNKIECSDIRFHVNTLRLPKKGKSSQNQEGVIKLFRGERNIYPPPYNIHDC